MNSAALIAFSSAFCGIAIALIAALRERRSAAWWFFLLGMALLSCESIFSGLIAQHTSKAEAAEAALWENWVLLTMCLLPGVWLLFSLSYARGNYREFLPKWRLVVGGVFLIPIASALCYRGRLVRLAVYLPESSQWQFHMTVAGWAACWVSLMSAVLILMNLERTFWASVGTMRWRIKFMVLGVGVVFVARVYTSSQSLFPSAPIQIGGQMLRLTGPSSAVAAVDSVALLLGALLVARSLFRGASDVAVYPSHTSLHKSVTAVVAGVYLLIVGVLAKLVAWFAISGSFQLRAFGLLVVVVGLTVLFLSDRVRLHTRRLVSRYLQRPLYDYRTVWRRFTEGTAERVNEKELCQVSVKLAAEIFQALSVSIWLVDDNLENLSFAASTSLSEAMAEKLRPSREEAVQMVQAMRNRSDPVDVEYSDENWALTLRRCHPSEFEEGGSRVCVPMVAGGELRGLMILGDRVGGVLFSLQDFDLLKCVGDQIAASLLNSQLSQKLLQAKELEAFQTMSAFFVHDLKNTAHTLNLMLQNLPVHYDNPEFRADALRGIAKSGQHINNLISRLSVLRHDLQIHPVETDLNTVVSRVLAGWEGAAKVQVVKKLGPVVKAQFDEEQILKVVTNLVLNASEAIARDGEIRVETSQSNGWVVLTVSDNGCGMDPEFLHRSLFRPFQTTKKEGFGIGMFQSKMIVEAHGGRVEVESELNKGTTFKVLLPVRKPK